MTGSSEQQQQFSAEPNYPREYQIGWQLNEVQGREHGMGRGELKSYFPGILNDPRLQNKASICISALPNRGTLQHQQILVLHAFPRFNTFYQHNSVYMDIGQISITRSEQIESSAPHPPHVLSSGVQCSVSEYAMHCLTHNSTVLAIQIHTQWTTGRRHRQNAQTMLHVSQVNNRNGVFN